MAYSACIGPYDASKYGNECIKNRGVLVPSNDAFSRDGHPNFYIIHTILILHIGFKLTN